MAAETPFGASFGDPRRYMGQSPLAEIGKGLKSGLTAYALKESGLVDYLNKLNPKPVQAVAPPTAVAPTAVQPTQPTVAPMMPVAPVEQGVIVNPIPDANTPPPDIGEQILNNTWTGFPSSPTGPTSLKNPTDFNPLAPDTSNQMAVSPNDYKNAPGYGKLAKSLGMLTGMG